MKEPTIYPEEIHELINEKILSDKPSLTTSLNYAISYCMHALSINDRHELAIQCLYILNNITHWRHKNAKETRNTLKQFCRQEGAMR